MSMVVERPLILVVEDDLANSEVITSTLVEFGDYHVVAERDAEQVIERLTALRPQLLLLDVMMPKRNGFEILRELRETPELASLPVVAMSADVRPAVWEQARTLGCLDFLPKPFGIDQLLEIVDRALRRTDGANDEPA